MSLPFGAALGAQAPHLSIVLPFRNARDTLLQTIQSVREQTFDQFEFILLDDGSVDGGNLTVIPLLGVREPRLSYYRIEKPLGQYQARLYGASIARGKYVLFLNQGDVMRSRKVLEGVVSHVYNGEHDFICLYVREQTAAQPGSKQQWPRPGQTVSGINMILRGFSEGIPDLDVAGCLILATALQYVRELAVKPTDFRGDEFMLLTILLRPQSKFMQFSNTGFVRAPKYPDYLDYYTAVQGARDLVSVYQTVKQQTTSQELADSVQDIIARAAGLEVVARRGQQVTAARLCEILSPLGALFMDRFCGFLEEQKSEL